MGAESYRIGELTLHPRLQLLRDGSPLPLGARALDVLSALAAANGDVVTKDQLIDEVWDGSIVEENAIQAQISALRKALGDEAGRLVTIHRRGYRLDVAVAGSPVFASVAVLPFDNLSDDPANSYLADGIAEELIATLSRVPGLKVPARSSSFAYRGKAVDARAIGCELGVTRLIGGSVRASEGRVRVSAQLVDTATGFHIWADNFDHDLTELFAMQLDIAAAIAAALETRLARVKPQPRDPEAYQLYLQAGALTAHGRPEDMVGAVALYRRAIERDPLFAPASARLSRTLLGASNSGVLPLAVREEARDRAEQSLRSEPTLAAAKMVIGGLDGLSGNWLAAEECFHASLALDPRESDCYSMHAYYVLAPCGHLARAQAAVDRAFELAPAVPLHSLGRATMSTLRGDGQSVMRHLQTAEALGLAPDEPPNRAIRAAMALHFGSWEDASRHIVVALPPSMRALGAETAPLVYRACLGLDDKAEASRAVARLAASADDALLTRHQIAFGTVMKWQIMLGALDAAFAIGERMIAVWRRTGQLATTSLFQMWLPDMRPFREDPRFGDFVSELGMVAYWRRHGPPDGHALDGDRLIAS